jgi:hypothetical protein
LQIAGKVETVFTFSNAARQVAASDIPSGNSSPNTYRISQSESRIACDQEEFLKFKMADLI